MMRSSVDNHKNATSTKSVWTSGEAVGTIEQASLGGIGRAIKRAGRPDKARDILSPYGVLTGCCPDERMAVMSRISNFLRTWCSGRASVSAKRRMPTGFYIEPLEPGIPLPVLRTPSAPDDRNPPNFGGTIPVNGRTVNDFLSSESSDVGKRVVS